MSPKSYAHMCLRSVKSLELGFGFVMKMLKHKKNE